MANSWKPEFLESMRAVTDPTADDAVKALVDSSPNQEKAALELFDQIVRDDAPVPAAIPGGLKDYFEQTAGLPPGPTRI